MLEPIYISAPEYQVLDNDNHPDAKLGKDNNRQSASLYDMIPAVPQNAKPFGEWNKAKIMVYKVRLFTDRMTRMYSNITCGPNNGLTFCRPASSVRTNGRWLSNY